MIKIQLVDDEPQILRALQRVLRPHDWELHCFSDAQAALEDLNENRYAAILSDYQMPHLDGITYLQFAKQCQPQALRLLLTAHGDQQSMMRAINHAEIYRFLPKPWEDFEVENAMTSAVDLYQLRQERQCLLDQLKHQQNQLERQRAELRQLEAQHPGITRVIRDADGAILLDPDNPD